jgi:CubicO group peptidase (beta-lactamase class C family)
MPVAAGVRWMFGALLACVAIAPHAAQTQESAAKRALPAAPAACASGGAAFAPIDAMLESAAASGHFPGAILGVMSRGRLLHCKALGVSDLDSKRPVDVDTVFRIASMTKSVTGLAVLQLRDRGKLALTDNASRWIPELPRTTPPAQDRPIRLLDLLAHTAGFVTDDPWGDRQLPLSDAAFAKLIAAGVPRARVPGIAYEYSNYGYALLGRVVTRSSGTHYQDYVQRELLQPLGMTSSGFDPATTDPARRARGYRHEDGRWREEPVLGDGAFASMGGLQTTARDYVRYIDFVLDAWSTAKDSPHEKILSRATRRELAQPTSFPRFRQPDAGDAASCAAAIAYSYGMHVITDCRFTNAMTHSGGLPGYGSNVLFLPQHESAVFLFVNRTYAPAAATVRKIAARLADDGVFSSRTNEPSAALRDAADAAAKMYAAADVGAAPGFAAENLLPDRDLTQRNLEIRQLRERLGACRPPATIRADHALSGTFTFECERGKLSVEALLAPTLSPQFQKLEFTAK